MSEQDKQSRRLAALEQERQAYGLPQMPYPDLVRWIYPEEISSVMVPCLREKGFIVSSDPSGTGITGQVPSPQNRAFSTAYLECTAMYSIDPRVDVVPDKTVLSATYDYWSESVIPCVRELGFSMADLPTRETWLADPKLLDDYPFGNPEVEVACPYSIPSKIRLGEE